jgi:predicted nucleotide-binding protein (sugar kinase/HSP70/actin superfamily)
LQSGLGGRKHVRHALQKAGPWVTYHLGADGTESVANTWELMNAGFDGMVHVKPFGCMPEVSAMSVLQRISREHTFPILSVSYDAQTAETGIRTRVEAFADMLHMRAQGRDRA